MTSEDDNDGRDRRGRWVKGHCPNPTGRPRKMPQISEADVGFFKQTMVEATINGEKRYVSRHELLLHAMYEQALKGKISLARKLFDRFESVDTLWAEAHLIKKRIGEKLLEQYNRTGDFDEKLLTEYSELSRNLNYGQEAKPPRTRRTQAGAEPNWRRRPKPQAVLDLEREWVEAAENSVTENSESRVGINTIGEANDE